MSAAANFEEEESRRRYGGPYTSRHPIPTVQKYRAERDERDQRLKATEAAQHDEQDESNIKRAYNSAKAILKGEDEPKSSHDPYPTVNQNIEGAAVPQKQDEQNKQQPSQTQTPQSTQKIDGTSSQDASQEKSATEAAASHIDPKQKRKDMKNYKRDAGGREVTDPITHLPIVIRDQTDKDLNTAPENEPESGTQPRTMTGLSGASKEKTQLDSEQYELQKTHDGMQKLFPPPSFDDAKSELMKTYQLALTVGLSTTVALATLAVLVIQVFDLRISRNNNTLTRRFDFKSLLWTTIPLGATLAFAAGVGFTVVTSIRGWLGKKVEEVWDDEVWDAARAQEVKSQDNEAILPESVAWLNSLLSSVWPLINPDLFTSVADMLEDVMQASLPKVVRMVSVDDLGQGSEAFRILGVKWLPTGAASQSVDADGNLKSPEEDEKDSDRNAPGEGQQNNKNSPPDTKEDEKMTKEEKEKAKQKEQEEQAIREGMEAEQGDFVNMELAFAYRARSSGKSIKSKAKNAHLYLRFYLPGGIAVPVWVELRGLIGKMRLRLQLGPDPPFFSLCTLSFMGQPKADLSCVPLSKHALNLMDVPLISGFVQSAIDAALAEYVAPKSLTLDLKDMLVGDDFKKDTVTRGVVMIYIKQARDFKEGDGGIGPMKGSSDSYVTVSWGKFGKPAASTRIIIESQKPNWHEWSQILVSPEELNAREKLRLQLWDSDKHTADDDLGRVEVDIHELMHGPSTKNKMSDREDCFVAEDPDEKMPGTLSWSVGYFEKVSITKDQLEKQTEDPDIRSIQDLKEKVGKTAESKLREATAHDESKEIKQQKLQDYKEREDALMISAPPPDEYPSGIFSIQIHNITGLEVQQLRKRVKDDQQDREDEAEKNDDLPSSYANIIINQQKVYRTRTKPKNAKPFFNAGTERFVRDWRTTEVMISVRDSREKENDALLGMVYLPLNTVFAKRSQVMDSYPLVGGIGYGRCRISMVWRSVDLKLPKELLGWDLGTLEVKCPVEWKSGNSGGTNEVHGHRMKLRTNLMTQKLTQQTSSDGDQNTGATGGGDAWTGKKDETHVYLALRKRYASNLTIEFRKSTLGPDSTTALGVFWLQDIPDDEETNVTIKIWKGSKDAIKRATSSCGYNGMEEGEQPLGEIEMTIKFWRGLSGYHKSWANKSGNVDVKNVMEVLDTANDEKEIDNQNGLMEEDSESDSEVEELGRDDPDSNDKSENTVRRKLRTHMKQDSSGSEMSSDEDDENTKNPFKKVKNKIDDIVDGHNDEDDGSRGPVAQLRDYKDHHKQLHRQHRGIMQWRGARTMDWMAGKMKRGAGKVEDLFEHSEKDQGIETEV